MIVLSIVIGVLELFHPTVLKLRAPVLGIGAERLSLSGEADVMADGDVVRVRLGGREIHGVKLTATGPVELAIPGKIRRTYSGRVAIMASKGVLRALVTMDLEQAVGIVAGAEMPHGATAALEAQAIAARSYYRASKSRHQGFDFCDTTHCQVLQDESERGARAAAATKGQILTYEGSPVGAMYFRSCSGRTLRAADVKLPASGYPYFAVECEVCRRDPQKWESRVAKADAARLLQDGPSEALRLELARKLGWARMPSNTYAAEETGATVVFHGVGEGHGVGMCQRGADTMARLGATSAEIVAHYYPQTRVRK